MKRWMIRMAALVGVQLLLLSAWWAVENGRVPGIQGTVFVDVEPQERPAPGLRYERADGSTGALSDHGGEVLVHIWATWCPPCIDELPALLEWAERHPDTTVLAATVDKEWDLVNAFFDGQVPAQVVRVDVDEVVQWGTEGVPTTFFIQSWQIHQVARGPLEWSKR